MAMADYRLCDVCNGKAFYDANLNYQWPNKNGKDEWGQEIEEDEFVRDSTHKLDYLGDWSVICRACARTHKTIIVSIESEGGDV
jgi:hypothetical protein